MDVEEKIKDCEYNLNQIIHFNPDPYYVSHFFANYLQCVIEVYDGILEEANRDFGLYISGRCTVENFESKSKEKNDESALKFLSWFKKKYKNEHRAPYPSFINKIISYVKQEYHLPSISIKIIADNRYKDDIPQKIKVNLKNGKLNSKDELIIEIKRQIPVFLEFINQKRKNRGEPKVTENQVTASTFVDRKNLENIEIPYACTTYLSVMKRFLQDSRAKIKQLTNRS